MIFQVEQYVGTKHDASREMCLAFVSYANKNGHSLPAKVFFTSKIEKYGGSKHTLTHILLLDCDCQYDLENAKQSLSLLNPSPGYTIYESTPGHYWVIVDIVSDITVLINLAKKIKGVDPKCISRSESNGVMVLRAITKKGFLPKKVGTIVNPSHHYNDYKKWVDEFDSYWLEQEVCAFCINQKNIGLDPWEYGKKKIEEVEYGKKKIEKINPWNVGNLEVPYSYPAPETETINTSYKAQTNDYKDIIKEDQDKKISKQILDSLKIPQSLFPGTYPQEQKEEQKVDVRSTRSPKNIDI